jgi:hypothetical protein
MKEEDKWCYYSDLPSPNAYIEVTDYDGMGNHHRFPKKRRKKNWLSIFKNLIKKSTEKTREV